MACSIWYRCAGCEAFAARRRLRKVSCATPTGGDLLGLRTSKRLGHPAIASPVLARRLLHELAFDNQAFVMHIAASAYLCECTLRTTIDLPDDLLRQAKILAVQRGSTLRDLVAAGLRAELANSRALPRVRQRLPAISLPADAPVLRLTPAQIGHVGATDLGN
jgi:hypothetical protein